MFFRHTLAFLAISPLLVLGSSGCIFLKAPEVAPTPTPPPPLPAVVFDPAAGQPRGAKLNDPSLPPLEPNAINAIPTPGTTPVPPVPNAFLLERALAGDLLVLRTVRNVKVGKNPDGSDKLQPQLGTIDENNPFRLAGIICPRPPALGSQDAIAAVFSWCAGQNLDVDIDLKYPEDANNRRLVHVFFKGRAGGKFEGQTLSLNRMLVRSGLAIVDLYSPTSFDQKEWLMDETFARQTRAGLWKTNAFAVLQQRLPSTGAGARAKVTVQTNVRSTVKTPKIVTLPPGVQVTPVAPTGNAPTAPLPGGAPAAGAPGGPPPGVPTGPPPGVPTGPPPGAPGAPPAGAPPAGAPR